MTTNADSAPAGGAISSDGLRLHYIEQGAGAVELVVVPGITSPAMTWAFVGEALADAADLRVITMDVRGRGRSDRPAPGGYTLPDYAGDVAALVRSLELDRPVVLGHSMGARVAAAFAALHPDLCGPTIVVDPPLSGPGREPYPFPLPPYVDALRKAQNGATVEDMRAQFPTWSDEHLRLRAEWLATCDETGLVESYENFHSEDFFDSWPNVAPPVLFMYGKDSPVVPETALPEVKQSNPAAEIVGIEGAGHMIPWDNFDDFVSEASRFIATAREAGR